MCNYRSQFSALTLGTALLLYYGFADGHVCDLHFRTPSEILLEEEATRNKEIERAERVLDSDSSQEEKREALIIKIENGRTI